MTTGTTQIWKWSFFMKKSGNGNRIKKLKKMLTKGMAALLTVSLVTVNSLQGAYAGAEPQREVIDLGNPDSYSKYLEDGVIVLPEAQGEYELTGSNTDANQGTGANTTDISICVEKGTSVKLYLNNLNLINSGFNGIDSDTKCPEDTKPALIVEGTAHVYCKNYCGDSLIKGVSDVIKVTDTGSIYFVSDQWSRYGGTLTIDSSDVGEAEKNHIFTGTGSVFFNGGNVFINPASGKTEINCDINLYGDYVSFEGEAVMCEGNSVYTYTYRVPENINTDSVSVMDTYGNDLAYFENVAYGDGSTSETFPKSASLLQFSRLNSYQSVKYAELTTDEDGNLSNIWLPSDCKLFIANGDTDVSCYEIENKQCKKAPVPAHTITLKGSTIPFGKKTYYAAEGDKVTLLSDGKYVYSYKNVADETPVTADTVVGKADMTIEATATEKQNIDITVYSIPDSTGQSTAKNISVPYGSSLQEAGITVPCYIEGSNNILLSDDVMTGKLTLHEIGNITVNDYNNFSLTISNKAEAELFAKLVNGNSSKVINGTLEADIELDNGFDMIGSGASFRGSFDGRNHTVTLNIEKDADYVGLFAKAEKGAKIENVNVTGTVKGRACVGGLVGKIIDSDEGVEISGCTNSANITAERYDVGGIVGGAGKCLIDCCVNRGKVATTSDSSNNKNSAGAIAGNSTYQSKLVISNCIDVSDSNLPLYSNAQTDEAFSAGNCYSVSVESAGVTKKAESSFKSGEVTYLLNSGMGETKWFQTCGEGWPSPYGDAETQTVYAGYRDCSSENFNMYSNDSDIHTEKGHQYQGEYYYSEGCLHALCRYCDQSITAEVSIPREVYGSSLEGVTVVCSEDWEAAQLPQITIEYSADSAGTFSSVKPETAGTFYLKALIDEKLIDINDTYTIIAFDTENWVSDENSHWHAAVNGRPDEVIDKADHTWDAGVVTTEATCTEDGVGTYTCTVCEMTKTEKIAATGHSFDTSKWRKAGEHK